MAETQSKYRIETTLHTVTTFKLFCSPTYSPFYYYEITFLPPRRGFPALCKESGINTSYYLLKYRMMGLVTVWAWLKDFWRSVMMSSIDISEASRKILASINPKAIAS